MTLQTSKESKNHESTVLGMSTFSRIRKTEQIFNQCRENIAPPTCLESMSQTNFKVANYSDILHSDWFKLLQWPTRERKESNSMNTIWLISFYKLYITYVLAKTTDVYPTHYWSNYCLCEHKRLPISFKSFFKLTPELKQTINF